MTVMTYIICRVYLSSKVELYWRGSTTYIYVNPAEAVDASLNYTELNKLPLWSTTMYSTEIGLSPKLMAPQEF